MTAAVETMAYANQVPWHGLGTNVKDDMTPEQMLKAASLDWTVSKRDLFFKRKSNGQLLDVKGEFALVRDSDETVLSMVGVTWNPVQNTDAMDFFKKYVTAGHMKMETAGSLWNGRYIWALARVGKDFKVGKGDEVRSYLLLCSPHVFGRALVIQFTGIRVVCWNTLNFALGHKLSGDNSAFRVPHYMKFDDKVAANAEVALGIAGQQADEFQEAVMFLAKKKATEPKVEEYFMEVLKYDASKAVKKKDESLREPKMLPLFRQALTHAPGQTIDTAAGTWWGAVNAVTYVVDHEVGRERSTALKTAWLGSKAKLKRRAFDLAADYAKQAKAA